VGGREDDYRAASASFHERGKHFDEQLPILLRIWSGQSVSNEIGPIGPQPVQSGGPELLIGGYSSAAIQRLRHWGNGFISGGGDLEQAQQFFNLARNVWKEAGRQGQPRLVGCAYYGLGT